MSSARLRITKGNQTLPGIQMFKVITSGLEYL